MAEDITHTIGKINHLGASLKGGGVEFEVFFGSVEIRVGIEKRSFRVMPRAARVVRGTCANRIHIMRSPRTDSISGS